MSRTPSGRSTEGSEAGGPRLEARPPVILGRGDLAAAAVMAAISYLTAKFTTPTGPGHAALFLAASICVIAAGRLADRLWDSTVATALRTGLPGFRMLARYPFRLLGGGIAFTVILLAAKRAGLIPVRDVPVIEIFATGAILSAGYHAFADGWRHRGGPGHPGRENAQERNAA